ncbi:type II 3-dehydroquinate dehydratase [Adlercreutzia sp. ZJ141]|uniref:type II 3-dehydroquinate dehydratase n=1 Tax=Adlercreutzia sp. ZJ141 TaxID=2709406 RepID=UPI0013ECBF92|nr:type II 3-dehydroquinate dehydratase [Adlercreutzia sp. ZJ141]
MKKILLINGPNLNMLGIREPGVYGNDTLESLERMFCDYAKSRGVAAKCFQSNHEGELVEKLHEAHFNFDGVVYNPGAHTHYSYAIRDAVGSIATPVVEVHISDVSAREAWRNVSVVAPACVAQVKGRGFQGYCDALDILLDGAAERLGEGFEEVYAPGQVIIAGKSARREEKQ